MLDFLQGGREKNGIDHAEVLEYSDSKEKQKWIRVGAMSKARSYQAISIVDMEDFKNHCQ